jgi:hypothetical protein
MKLKLTTTIALAATLIAGVVATTPALGKGKPPKSGAGCKPQISIILDGTLAGAPSGTTFQMTVTHANHFGAALVTATQLTIRTNTATKITRNGPQTSLSTFVSGDAVQVQYRTCKADVSTLTPTTFNANTTLFAKRVTAHVPGTDNDNENENENENETGS